MSPLMSNLHILAHSLLNGAIKTERAGESAATSILTKFSPGERTEALGGALCKR